MIYGGGKFWNNWQRRQGTDRFIGDIPKCDTSRRSLEKSIDKCGINNFFLHWAKAPPSFECQNWMQQTFSMRENDYFIQIEPREWDSCIYLDQVSHATPAVSSM